MFELGLFKSEERQVLREPIPAATGAGFGRRR